MIQANELRRGNLFYRINRTQNVHLPIEVPMVVDGITSSTIKYYHLEEKVWEILKDKEIPIFDASPIQLTEDILLKCGFVDTSNGYRANGHSVVFKNGIVELWQGDVYNVASKIYGWHIIYGHNDIFYLHQLQNLYFALTQQELNIQL